jgi:hypothetical protein
MTALAPSGQTTRHRYTHSILTVVASAPVGGPRRCPLPASLDDVGVGPARTNRACQSLVPGTDPPERNHRVKSRTATRRKSPRRTCGVHDQGAGQTPPGTPRPFSVGRAGEGGTETGTQPGRTWATPTPQDASRGASGAGPVAALDAAPPRPGRVPGGGPADRPRVSRECTGRVDPSKRAQTAVVPDRLARGQVLASPSWHRRR